MGRQKVSVPKYCKHAPSGQAVVFIDRKTVYLGPYGSPESRQRYSEELAKLSAPAQVDAEDKAPSASGTTVSDLCMEFVRRKFPSYKTSTGQESAEKDCCRGAMRIMRKLYGETPVDKFGPSRLSKVRERMIELGWKRRFINKQIGRIRYIFRLGVSWEIVPETVYRALATMDALKPGESDAPESVPREAVPLEHISAVKSHLRERNRDLVDLLLLTAARPGEILALTTSVIDRKGDVWVADFKKHKTARHGHFRAIHFGLRAQSILLKYLKPLNPDERLFPIQRKTFGSAVKAASVKAGVPAFTPHWLRHTALTMIAEETDIESAQRVAGHSTAAMTILYTRAAKKKAEDAVKKMG
jgi:integrase